jgi:hypothetical protein
VQHLGYVEFGVARQMFVQGAFRRHLSNELALRTFEDSLAAADTLEQRWDTIVDACRSFGFSHAEMKFNGTMFSKKILETNGDPTWGIHIPLAKEGYLHLKRCFGDTAAPTVVAPFATVLRRSFCNVATKESIEVLHSEPKVVSHRRSAAAGA